MIDRMILIFLALFATSVHGYHSRMLSRFNARSVRESTRLFAERVRSERWAEKLGMVPGYGGYWPGDPNAKRYNVTLVSNATGESFSLQVPRDRYIFFYFEEEGIDLPIINKQRMCRQGCCTICTGKVLEGKVKMDAPLGLLKDLRQEGFSLTCCSYPRADTVIELQDEDEMYVRQWGATFESGGVEWGGFLPDDD